MKKYNVIYKKNDQLILSFITYDKKVEKLILKQLKKVKRNCNIVEVTK